MWPHILLLQDQFFHLCCSHIHAVCDRPTYASIATDVHIGLHHSLNAPLSFTSTIHLLQWAVNFNGVNMFQHPQKPKYITNFMGPSFQCHRHYTSTDLINSVWMTLVPQVAHYPHSGTFYQKMQCLINMEVSPVNHTYLTCLIRPGQSSYIRHRLELRNTTTLHTTAKTKYLRPPLLNGRRRELLPRNTRPCPRRNLNVSPPPPLRFRDCKLWLRPVRHRQTDIQCLQSTIKLNSRIVLTNIQNFFKEVWMLYHWIPLHTYPF